MLIVGVSCALVHSIEVSASVLRLDGPDCLVMDLVRELGLPGGNAGLAVHFWPACIHLKHEPSGVPLRMQRTFCL
jgi:hypothetical protein